MRSVCNDLVLWDVWDILLHHWGEVQFFPESHNFIGADCPFLRCPALCGFVKHTVPSTEIMIHLLCPFIIQSSHRMCMC
jgi:hypothetical protein